jgi:hypothetical protein
MAPGELGSFALATLGGTPIELEYGVSNTSVAENNEISVTAGGTETFTITNFSAFTTGSVTWTARTGAIGTTATLTFAPGGAGILNTNVTGKRWVSIKAQGIDGYYQSFVFIVDVQ